MGEGNGAQAWVEKVSRAGFRIGGGETKDSLVIWKIIQIGNDEQPDRNLGWSLVDEVPFRGESGPVDLAVNLTPGALSSRLEFIFGEVEASFWEEVAELGPGARAWVQRMDELNGYFDAKVGSEVENDPEILALEAKLSKARQTVVSIEDEIGRRRGELTQTKEGTREDFLTLAGREI